MLDDRFFKSPNDRLTGEKTIIGSTQFEWLIDALSSSKATFKIIVIGGQVLNPSARFENYENYPKEKEKLLSEIEANKIKGVLFLTGDRHFSELSKLNRENTYPLYDWTVSPLTSGVGNSYKDDVNTNRVEGSLFAHSFGVMRNGQEAASIQKKVISWGDTYEINVNDDLTFEPVFNINPIDASANYSLSLKYRLK